jgi:hypothetical protein
MTRYSQVQQNKAAQKVNVRKELNDFEQMLEELKIQYEQFFLGVLPMQPEKLHGDVKRALRRLFKLPFKNSEMSFRLRMLENRYTAYNSYWMRILKQKEDGTYSRDVFKAELRKRTQQHEVEANSAQGAASKQMKDLFQTYKDTLERQTNRTHDIRFEDFKRSLVKKAKVLQEQHGSKKFNFKVVVKNGKVTISAQSK